MRIEIHDADGLVLVLDGDEADIEVVKATLPESFHVKPCADDAPVDGQIIARPATPKLRRGEISLLQAVHNPATIEEQVFTPPRRRAWPDPDRKGARKSRRGRRQ